MSYRAGLGALLLAFGGVVAWLITIDAPFEYDEAVYAVQARAWATDTHPSGVLLHRAPLLPAIGTLIVEITNAEAWFRLTGLVAGLATLMAIAWIAWMVGGRGPSLVAVAALGSNPHLLQRSAQFLTDVPATALLLAVTGLGLRELVVRDAPSRAIVLAAPAAAAAIYLRYASVLPVGLLFLAVAVAWHRRAWVRGRLALLTGGAFALALVPHIVQAVAQTGRPWGLITFTARVARQAGYGEGLVQYAEWAPGFLAGPVAGGLMVVGLGAAVVRSVIPPEGRLLLVGPGLVTIVALGIGAHAEPRFVLFPVALLVIAGSVAVFHVGRTRPPFLLVAVVASVVLIAGVGTVATAWVRVRSGAQVRAVVEEAGALIDRDRDGSSCEAYTFQVPIVAWYSGCATFTLPELAAGAADLPTYIVSFNGPRWPYGSVPGDGSERIGTVRGDPRRYGDAVISLRSGD